MTPVVFFSHSSDDNARADALRQALESGGVLKTTFDVRDLRQGEAWRPQLYKWMASCHAGLLLVTKQVMVRPAWVLQEATLLRARAMLEGKAFRLFILLDKAAGDDPVWKQWFAPLNLPDLQSFVLPEPDANTAPFVSAVQAEMRALATQPPTDDYFHKLAALIRDALVPLRDAEVARSTLAEGLQVDDADWQRIIGDERRVEQVLAQRLCQGDFGRFEGIAGLFQELQGLCDAAPRRHLFGLLRSYWVPLIRAARVAEALGRVAPYAAGAEAPPNLVLLPTDGTTPAEVVQMVLERQFAPYRRMGSLLRMPPGQEDDFVEELRTLLVTQFLPNSPDASDDEIAARLDERRRAHRYVFVFVGAPASLIPVRDAAAIFWPCVFLVGAPGASPRYRELAGLLAVTEPQLPPGARTDVWHLDELAEVQNQYLK